MLCCDSFDDLGHTGAFIHSFIHYLLFVWVGGGGDYLVLHCNIISEYTEFRPICVKKQNIRGNCSL